MATFSLVGSLSVVAVNVKHPLSYYTQVKEWARTRTVDLARILNSSQHAAYEGNINIWIDNDLTPEAIHTKEQKRGLRRESRALAKKRKAEKEKEEARKNVQLSS